MEAESPVPVPTHFKFTLRGIFLNSPETWSFGCHFSRVNAGEPDAGLDDIDESGVTSAIATFFGTAEISNKVEVGDWRMYVIGSDNRMEGNGPLLHEYEPGELRGVSTGPIHPPQVALVITTVADNKGPARFGRFFLPGPTVALDNDWRIGEDEATGYAEQCTQLLKGISDHIDLQQLVSSKGKNISPGPQGSPGGTSQDIDHLEVGRALDTLRTRRKSLLEERHVHGQIDW